MNFEQLTNLIKPGDVAIKTFGIRKEWHNIERDGVKILSITSNQYNKLIRGKKTEVTWNGNTSHKTVL